MYSIFCFFFFSSRRRHTRFDCDWSSDVCSSDLQLHLRSGRENRIVRRTGNKNRRSKVKSKHCRLTRDRGDRSEEHTSELQSQSNLVCRLLLEKKKKKKKKKNKKKQTKKRKIKKT